MSIILYDPSESKTNTRLSQTVIDAGRPLNGLEQYTGGDILVSPLSLPIKELGDDTSFNLLKHHINSGVLIQRKTGRDAVGSIPNYPAILQRMLQWTTRPYLVTIGQYGSNKDGKVIVDGHETEWSWNAYKGALDWWELRGGYYADLSRDGQLLSYLNQWLERLSDDSWNGTSEYKVVERFPKQVLGKQDWVGIVMGLGIGFGHEKAKYLEENFSGLGQFLSFFSDEDNLKLVKKVKGIGASQFRKTRALLNLHPRCAIGVYDKGEGE